MREENTEHINDESQQDEGPHQRFNRIYDHERQLAELVKESEYPHNADNPQHLDGLEARTRPDGGGRSATVRQRHAVEDRHRHEDKVEPVPVSVVGEDEEVSHAISDNAEHQLDEEETATQQPQDLGRRQLCLVRSQPLDLDANDDGVGDDHAGASQVERKVANKTLQVGPVQIYRRALDLLLLLVQVVRQSPSCCRRHGN
mmetsp:Transcript_57629/g.153999  ORF Transcript_57629/g.153999 Transcript_57629/m.153999 type:complete len:201 (-) Transcript_57629:178-780(-)